VAFERVRLQLAAIQMTIRLRHVNHSRALIAHFFYLILFALTVCVFTSAVTGLLAEFVAHVTGMGQLVNMSTRHVCQVDCFVAGLELWSELMLGLWLGLSLVFGFAV